MDSYSYNYSGFGLKVHRFRAKCYLFLQVIIVMQYLYLLTLLLCFAYSAQCLGESADLARLRRSSNSSDSLLTVSFTLGRYEIGSRCFGGNSAGLGSTDLRLEYRNNGSDFQWVELAGDIPMDAGALNASISVGPGCVEFRLVQEETVTAGHSAMLSCHTSHSE